MKFIVSILAIVLFIYQVKGHFDEEDHEIEKDLHSLDMDIIKDMEVVMEEDMATRGMEVVMDMVEVMVVAMDMEVVMATKDMAVVMEADMVMVEAMDIIKYSMNMYF
nr:uncharacterized protein LOC121114930 [Lepeophtheirus salmonis]